MSSALVRPLGMLVRKACDCCWDALPIECRLWIQFFFVLLLIVGGIATSVYNNDASGCWFLIFLAFMYCAISETRQKLKRKQESYDRLQAAENGEAGKRQDSYAPPVVRHASRKSSPYISTLLSKPRLANILPGQTSGKKCLNGHAVIGFITWSKSRCNVCQRAIPRSTFMFGCDECNYDICISCDKNVCRPPIHVTPQNSAMPQNTKSLANGDRTYKCGACGVVYKTKKELRSCPC